MEKPSFTFIIFNLLLQVQLALWSEEIPSKGPLICIRPLIYPEVLKSFLLFKPLWNGPSHVSTWGCHPRHMPGSRCLSEWAGLCCGFGNVLCAGSLGARFSFLLLQADTLKLTTGLGQQTELSSGLLLKMSLGWERLPGLSRILY